MLERRPSGEPSFWNELYWFLALGLSGLIVAAMVLPPRVASTAQLLRREREVLGEIQTLKRREDLLEGAASAMENDPFYREGVFRARLQLKKESEEYLEVLPSPIR